MILKEEDVYNGFESYRNKNGLSQEQMAELVGLKTKQAYGNMIKNKTMKVKYLINLINNTGVSSDSILNIETRKKQPIKKSYAPDENINFIGDEKVTFYTCPECIEKENIIKDLRANLNDLRKHIEFLEFSLGKKKAISK